MVEMTLLYTVEEAPKLPAKMIIIIQVLKQSKNKFKNYWL